MEVGGNATHLPGKRYFTKADNLGNFVNKLAKNLLGNSDCRIYTNDLKTCDNALSQKVKLCTDIGQVIHKFTAAITAACDSTFQMSRPGKRANKQCSVPWWTSELMILCKKALALRRRYQRTKTDANLRQKRRLLYLGSNRLYQAKLREEKLKSWKDFCTSTDSSNPWNAVYRYAAGRLCSKPTLLTLKARNNTYTTDMQSTINRLMDHFVTEDNEYSDRAFHK